MNKIYYCESCGFTGIEEGFDMPIGCPECGGNLIKTNYTAADWMKLSENQKPKIVRKKEDEDEKSLSQDAEMVAVASEKINRENENNFLSSDDSWKEDIHNMANDIHFIKTVVLVYVILSIIAGIIIGFSLL